LPDTYFLRLAELKKNDDVQIWYKGKEYHYTVMRTQEVYPTEVNVVRDEKEADLILQTCTPLGTDWKRLLVFAKKIKAKE
jgi:LPXTG-site transpeptidase (sortase) family protein